jgi:glutamate dehydrogenase/leucine dehydrogenase
MLPVHVQKLEQTDAFVVRDLGPDVPAVGIVRQAPKILQDGAELLARSVTYAFASFEQQRGGASGGINAKPDDRAAAIDAFTQELLPAVADGALVLDAGRGLAPAELAPLAAADGRSPLYDEHGADLRGLGAAICADAAIGLEGKDVAIEGFDASGPALVKAVYDRGGRVVAIGTAKGTVTHPKGLDGPMLAQAWREHGVGLVEHVDVVNQPAAELFAVEAAALFCGSKAGVIDHDLAAALTVGAVVPTGPVPVTAKALAVLRRAEVPVLPDFITTAGPLFALRPGDDATADGVRGAASVAILGALGEVLGHESGPLLGACLRAEAFLSTWRDELPFGRPLA